MASVPSLIGPRYRCEAIGGVGAAIGGRGNSKGIGENRRLNVIGECVLTFGSGAARDLQVHAEVAAAIALNEFLENPLNSVIAMWGYEGYSAQTVCQPLQMVGHGDQATTVAGYDFVYAIPEQKTSVHGRDLGVFQRRECAVEIGLIHATCSSERYWVMSVINAAVSARVKPSSVGVG